LKLFGCMGAWRVEFFNHDVRVDAVEFGRGQGAAREAVRFSPWFVPP
jgi:hypothetical protein